LAAVIDGEFETGGAAADNCYRYLTFLRDLDDDRLYEWTCEEYTGFLVKYPDDERAEEIHLWLADTYARRGLPRAAVASYLKYEVLNPAGRYVPEVKHRRARLLYKDLNDPKQAIDVLSELIDFFPRSDFAGSALYLRADIRAEALAEYDRAVADYRHLAATRPDDRAAAAALMAAADITAAKLRDYRAAVAIYDGIAELYPADSLSLGALGKSARLCLDQLQDYAGGAARYAGMARLFPGHEKSPSYLFEAAEICEKEAADYAAALEYYRSLVSQYPSDRHAQRAGRRIDYLEDKLVAEGD
jgi:TolA-binding protein